VWATNAGTYLIRFGGTPTATGTYNFTFQIYDASSCGSGDNDTRSTSITIVAGVLKPAITVQPSAAIVNPGTTNTFSVTATGTAPLSYQWRFSATNNLPGANSPTLTIANIQATNDGLYSVVITNTAGAVTSSAVRLFVRQPPAMTADPAGQTITAGQPANFSSSASGTPLLSSQWFVNGNPIPGASSTALTIPNTRTNQSGTYTVVYTNLAGAVTSAPALLTVNLPTPPEPDTPPAPAPGGPLVFTFAPVPGLTNTVLSAPSPEGPWTPHTIIPPPIDASPLSITGNIADPQQFFRLQIDP
jgi:hypothetical protein